MSSLFCCSSIEPYRSQYLSHQSKFNNFMAWASFPKDSSPGEVNMSNVAPSFAVQLVRQVNFGPLESKRYFIPTDAIEDDFVEITEGDLIQANFQKVNTYVTSYAGSGHLGYWHTGRYKNYRCAGHNKFFEVNIYQKNPVNEHHWRANIARPAGLIDLWVLWDLYLWEDVLYLSSCKIWRQISQVSMQVTHTDHPQPKYHVFALSLLFYLILSEWDSITVQDTTLVVLVYPPNLGCYQILYFFVTSSSSLVFTYQTAGHL